MNGNVRLETRHKEVVRRNVGNRSSALRWLELVTASVFFSVHELGIYRNSAHLPLVTPQNKRPRLHLAAIPDFISAKET